MFATSGRNINSSAQINPGTILGSDIANDEVVDANIGAHTTTKITVPTTKLSGTVTKAQLATGTQGDVFIATTAGAAAALAIGASGTFLKSNGAGADPSWAAPSSIDKQTFTASGTWTKPAGVSAAALVYIQAWGGGGGSNGMLTNESTTGGGGGGYRERWILASQLGATESVTVGAAGGAGTSGTNDATNGGDSIFGTRLTAKGGAKGANSAINAQPGGTGGGNGAFSFAGGAGVNNSKTDADYGGGSGGGQNDTTTGSVGGNSLYGAGGGAAGGFSGTRTGGTSQFEGGAGGNGSNNGVGTAGSAPGGGAGGGFSNAAGSRIGAAGARGEVRVYTFQ